MKRKTDVELGRAALRQYATGDAIGRAELRIAVRYTLEEFAQRHPGRSVEIRVPGCAAVQAIAGLNHRRGTPPNVVELDAQTWLNLVLGRDVDSTTVRYSGTRADIFSFLPLAHVL